ncbi:MAG TPA: benzoate-CoA ligase family protein [Alphaproteobacteria bacterium]|nr:benzoate-CoA ligase family protein [Alphaproteobacteria bacterium]
MNAADAVLLPTIEKGFGHSPALVYRDRIIAYTEVLAGVNQAGHAFRALGVAPENRIVVMLSDSPDFVSCYLGAIKIGAVAVAVNLRASPRDLLYYLRDSRARVLVIAREFLDLYRQIRGELAEEPGLVVAEGETDGETDLATLLARQPRDLDAVPMSPDDMAFWIYTSGTTGTPKAAVHLHKDVLNAGDYLGGVLGVRRGDRLFASSKLFFAYALGNCLFGAFRLGATTILLDDWPQAVTIAQVIERQRPSVVFAVPTIYRNLLAAGVATQEGFRAVRHYVSAGERLPESLWERWRAATGVEIIDGMGTSETIYMLLTNYPGAVRPGSSGKPAPGVEVKLADAEGVAVPPGQSGILWGRIASRADRYWNQQARSQEVFRGSWFRTGDMYRVDGDGYWFHEGRFDDLLKISGQWVSPAEIEDLLLAELPLRDAIVVGTAGKDDLMRLTLFAVGPAEGFDPADLEQRIRVLVTARLSVYKCPKWIRFVDAIPRTATGKAQRFELRRQAEALLEEEAA